MISIQESFRRAARKVVWIYASVAVLLAVSLLALEIWQNFLQRNKAAVDGMSPYLAQLLRTNDIFDATRQLDALLESRSFSGFWLVERSSGRIVTQGSAFSSGYQPPPDPTHQWWIGAPRGRPEFFSRYSIGESRGPIGYELITASELPLETVFFLLLLTVGLLAVLYLALFFQMTRLSGQIVQPMVSMAKLLEGADISAASPLPQYFESRYEEIAGVYRQFYELYGRLKRSEQDRALAELATQVAHDIRSPLAALQVVVHSAERLPEEQKQLINAASARIRDIGNQLLDRYRGQVAGLKASAMDHPAEALGSETLSIEPLTVLVESAVLQIQAQDLGREGGVKISTEYERGGFGLFSAIQPTELSRVLNNLINNAIEASEGKECIVRVALSGDSSSVIVRVVDQGKGIPPELLPQLGTRGLTYGKVGGSGLGLYHARASVERWGGSVGIESTVGKGTTVSISLPRTDAPDWFASELVLDPGTTVVILDDDPSIHRIWDARIGALNQFEAVHCSTIRALTEWYRSNLDKAAHYLVDYEISGERQNGLDAIETLGVSRTSVLVTNRADDREVRARCRKSGVRVLPKTLAHWVPIRAR